MNSGSDRGLRVLHVEDQTDFAEISALHLERIDPELTVENESKATAAIDRIQNESFDCVVSDYNMPEMDGIEFLRTVRERNPDLPFILFTGRGSEEIASEAISAGVTDYLQKETGTEQYEVLANRIKNTVQQYRAVKEVEDTREFYQRILDHSSDYVIIVNEEGIIDYVSPAVERVMGYGPETLIGTNSFEFAHPDDRQEAFEALGQVLTKPDGEVTVEFRSQDADGNWRWIEVRGGNLLDDPIIGGIMVNVRDVTRRKEHQMNLQQQSERFQELTRYLSHDMKNQLSIVDGHLALAKMATDDDNLDVAERALDRVEEMIEKISQLAESGPTQLQPSPTNLEDIVLRSWSSVGHSAASLEHSVDYTISADAERLQQLLENLFRNAIEHGGHGVTVRVGEMTGESPGFFVENDGPSLPVDESEQIFESGFTTSDEGTGLGLAIVNQIVDSHQWSITVTEPTDEGVRFEITDIERP